MRYLKLQLILAGISLIFLPGLQANHLSEAYLFAGKASGEQEVPAINTDGYGLISIFVGSDRETACLSFTAVKLSGPINGIHLHQAVKGENGDVIVDLTPLLKGNRITAELLMDTLAEDFLKLLLDGEIYLNVHTDENLDGEIRAQLELEEDFGFLTTLSGNKEVPPIATNASGLATVKLTRNKSRAYIKLVVDNLSSPITGIHLHKGAEDEIGDVVANLSGFIDGNVIQAEIDATAIADDLLSGNIYINVHTEDNLDGEIRGQLMLENRFMFDSSMDTEQVTGSVMLSDARGLSAFVLNHSFDTLQYFIHSEGLSGTILTASIHEGALEESGAVLAGLPEATGADGLISGEIGGALVTDALISNLMTGNSYTLIATVLNAGGEIRGQNYRYMREGYVMNLDGDQEVTANTGLSATGNGMISINREQNNAHLMIVVRQLSGPLNGAHFHKNVAGENGDVIFNMTDQFEKSNTEDGAFFYWTSSSTTPFNAEASALFQSDSIYLNIHTNENTDGEIRGQTTRGADCYLLDSSSEISYPNSNAAVQLYPNPLVDGKLFIKTKHSGLLKLFSIKGQLIMNKEIDQSCDLNLSGLDAGIYQAIWLDKESGIQEVFPIVIP